MGPCRCRQDVSANLSLKGRASGDSSAGFLLNRADLFRILPEVVLTLTGVVVMLIDASLPVGIPRRPLGFVAARRDDTGAVGEPAAAFAAGGDRLLWHG